MKKLIFTLVFLNSLFVVAQSFNCGDTLIDIRDGKRYATILIGSQCWLQDNLNFGKMIRHSSSQSNNSFFEKYCYDDDSTNCSLYGGLYQWNEVMNYSTNEGTQGLCPNGWHLPSDIEWKTLEMFLGMSKTSADSNRVFRGTNQTTKLIVGGSSKFNAQLSGGFNGNTQLFEGISKLTLLWTSTMDTESLTYRRGLYDFETRVWRSNGSPDYGYCVRCLSNNLYSINSSLNDKAIKIYPVPLKDVIFIETSNYTSILSFQLINMQGIVVKSWTSNQKNYSISIKDYPKGIYFARIYDGKQVLTEKIIIQ